MSTTKRRTVKHKTKRKTKRKDKKIISCKTEPYGPNMVKVITVRKATKTEARHARKS